MHKQRIYIDTSVIGGCFDDEFKEWSNKLFEEFVIGKKIALVSKLTVDELQNARTEVKDKITSIPNEFIEYLLIPAEAADLAESYLKNKIITKKSTSDALHIAIATISNSNVLVSWNFRHIVNLDKISKYNMINIINGYKPIEIRTPREVLNYV
jgi:predicted nucleic acid-binding protein